MILRYAVMGYPVAHSLSPTIHQLFAEQTGNALLYEKIEIVLPNFEQQVMDFFAQGGMGLNITLPCKERAYAMSDDKSARCLQAGAANTLWMKNARLQADNTDGVGLLRDLTRYIELPHKSILVLGAGGAVRGVLGPLLQNGPKTLVVANRTLEKALALQRDFPAIGICSLADLSKRPEQGEFDLVINATSASLDEQTVALPNAVLGNKPFCYDLAYNKREPTPFVKWARSLGSDARDGIGMLVEQAAEAFFIWHGEMPNTDSVLEHLMI